MTKALKYHLALIVSNLLFGINYSYYSSIIKNIMSADALFYLRLVADALFFMPFIIIAGSWRVKLSDIPGILLFVALLTFGRQYLMIKALAYTSPIDSSIIATLTPIFVMIIAAMAIKERIAGTRIAGMALAFIGAVALIISTATTTDTPGHLRGNLIALASVVSFSVNNVYAKGILSKYSPFTLIGWSSVISIIIATPLFYDQLATINITKLSLPEWGELAYIFIGGTIVASALFYYGLKHISPTAQSIYIYIQPFSATLFAILRGQGDITSAILISSVMIFAGVIITEHSFKPISIKRKE